MLDRQEIKELLPHREPFLLLDGIASLEPGQRATGHYYVDPDGFWFTGHFPGHPIFPGVLQLEALAQLGAVTILCQPRYKGCLPLFAGLDNVKFRRQVRPGDTLELAVEIGRRRGSYGLGQGIATVSGQTACEAQLKFILMKEGIP